MSRISLVAVLGAVVVAITLVVTWALWPREQPLAPGGQAVSAGESAAVTEFLIADPRWQRGQTGDLDFSGALVVWEEAAGERSGLFAADVRMHQRFALQRPQAGVQQGSPVIAGKHLVWTQRSVDGGARVELWAARPPHGQPFSLVNTSRRVSGDDGENGGTGVTPAQLRVKGLDASGDLVVWLERVDAKDVPGGVDDRVWLYDVASRAATRVKTAVGAKASVAVDEGLIAWAARGSDPGVWVRHTMTGQPVRVASSLATSVDISGSRVVWCTAVGDVYGFDLRTRRRFTVCVAAGIQADVRIAGDLVVWWDGRAARTNSTGNGRAQVSGDIYARDLSSGKEVAVSTDKAAQESPRVSGDTVVWLDDRSGRWQVRGAVVRH